MSLSLSLSLSLGSQPYSGGTPAPTPTPTPTPVLQLEHLDDGGGTANLWYNNASYPAWVKDPVANKVHGVIQRYDNSAGTHLKNNTHFVYDLDTGEGTMNGIIMTDDSADTGTADCHGVGTLCFDTYGNLWSFGGGHVQPLKVSCLPAAGGGWQAKTAIGTDLTYNRVALGTDGKLYVFTRDTVASNTKMCGVLYIGTITNGATPTVSWTSERTLVDFGTDSRCYWGQLVQVGTKIYVTAVRANWADSIRQDVYVFAYDTADGSISNMAGSFSTNGSTTIDRTSADTNYRIIDQATGSTQGGADSIVVDPSGNFWVLFQDGATGTELHIAKFNSSGVFQSRSTTPIATLTYRYAGPDFNAMSDGTIEVLYPTNSGAVNDYDTKTAFARGGDVYRKTLAAGASLDSFSAATLIKAATPIHPLDHCVRVKDGPADFRFAFCERAIADDDFRTGGNLRSYAWGASGFVTNPYVEDAATTALLARAGSSGDALSLAERARFNAIITGLVRTGWFDDLDIFYYTAAPNEGVARLNIVGADSSYDLVNVEAPTFTANSGFNGGLLDTGFNPTSSPSPNATQNSASTFIWCTTTQTTSAFMLNDIGGSGLIGINAGAGNGRIHDLTSLSLSTTNPRQLMAYRRAAASGTGAKRGRKSGVGFEFSATTASTGIPSTNISLLGGGAGRAVQTLGAAGYGAGGELQDWGTLHKIVQRMMYETNSAFLT